MKIKWLGHSCFQITSDKGVTIITDPYTPGGSFTYGEVKGPADIVTVSHGHGDHSNVKPIGGKPEVIRASGKAKGIEFKGIPAYHDEEKGTKRGPDTIFCFELDGIRLCHLGDLGHILTDEQMREVGRVDVLLIPVGGYYTIDAAGATRVIEQLKPKVTIPMHYKTEKCTLPIAPADAFLKDKQNVKKVNSSEVELKASTLPATPEIIVLKHAM